jgi:arabinofuranosyltransferase
MYALSFPSMPCRHLIRAKRVKQWDSAPDVEDRLASRAVLERAPSASSTPLARWDRAVLAAGAGVLAWIFYRQLMAGSVVVGGRRYFLLDDDMMVSMRYGRNLAEGHGLVWNAGERVEGYTNLLWTLVMAGVHVLPFGDAQAAVAIKVISFGLLVASLWLSLRLLRVFDARSKLAAVLVVVALVTCVDVVHWAAWGFETALLGFLELVFLVCLLEGRHMRVAWVALALIPLVRVDALHLFAADAVVALVLARQRRQVVPWLTAALVPFALQIVFRLVYYGDWLPNTYYLKLHLLDDRYGRGARYVAGFAVHYAPFLILAAVGAVAAIRADRRAIAVPVVIAFAMAYAVTTGGDMFINFRFLAHVMPLLFVLAAVGVANLGHGGLATVAAASVFLVVCIAPWRPLSVLVEPDDNGSPEAQVQAAVLISKNARADSRVAVFAAGIVPYFTRLDAVDILGKNDRHVAHLRPFPGARIGHGKLDPAHTLAARPDLVVTDRSLTFVNSVAPGIRSKDPVLTFLSSRPFQLTYRPHPIPEEFLISRTAVFTRADSREAAARQWQPVAVDP